MFNLTSRRRSPSTVYSRSMISRKRETSSSLRARVRRSGGVLVRARILYAVVVPIPKMQVSETQICLSRGMSTPAIRATCTLTPIGWRKGQLALLHLVLGVSADDHHRALAADDLAALTARFN